MQQYNPVYKRWDDVGVAMPNIEVAPGERPPLRATVAPYLPVVHYDVRDRDFFVVLPGKPIAKDSYGFLVPAGLAVDLATAIAAGNVAAAQLVYAAQDVTAGVINAMGNTVVAGEKVVASMIAAASGVTGATRTSATMAVGKFIGVAPYAYWRSSSDLLTVVGPTAATPLWDPADLRYHNYNPQFRVTVLCDYVVEYPVVTTYDPTLEGVAVFDASFGAMGREGGFVKVNALSNLILADCSTDQWCDIVGHAYLYDDAFPKGLEKVKTRWDPSVGGFSALDRAQGTATGGLPANMHYANTQTGIIWVNLCTR